MTRLIAHCGGPSLTGPLWARQRIIHDHLPLNLLRYTTNNLSIKAVHYFKCNCVTLVQKGTNSLEPSIILMSSFKRYVYVPNASSRVFPACRSAPTCFSLSSLRWHLNWTTTLLPACTNLCRTRWRRSHLSLE